MAMDFIKSCTTNVHTAEDVNSTDYCVYRHDVGEEATTVSGCTDRLDAAVADLRARDILCARSNGLLWVFGPLDPELKELVEGSTKACRVVEQGMVGDAPGSSELESTAARAALLEAIEDGVAYKLAKEYGVIHIGYWTWLYTTAREDGEGTKSMILCMEASLTPGGVLCVVPTVQESRLCRVTHDVQHGVTVTLAPRGIVATVALDNEDNNQAAKGPGWKEAVERALRERGFPIQEYKNWLSVELADQSETTAILWPVRLCFTTNEATASNAFDQEWKRWFAPPEQDGGFKNPLSEAEQWLKSTIEPEQPMMQAANHGDDQDAALSSNSAGLGTDLGTSPPFIQRLEQQNVAGIYPTPPDGMLPGPSSQQPTMETVSESNLPQSDSVTMEMAVDPDLVLPASVETQEETRAGRGFSLTSSIGDGNATQGGHDELFGEMDAMDAMDFAENEIGDADFSFFDEPDGQPVESNDGDDVLEARKPGPGSAMNDEEMLDEEQQDQDQLDGSRDTTFEAEPAIELPPSEPSVVSAKNGPAMSFDPPKAADHLYSVATDKTKAEIEKPLSPFGIRERLLPPPIPASAKQQEPEPPPPSSTRRSSSFAPVQFRENSSLASRYAQEAMAADQHRQMQPWKTSIGLPPKRKKLRREMPKTPGLEIPDEIEESSDSEEDSYESETSASDAELPPKLPWESGRKRRRVPTEEDAQPIDKWMDNDSVADAGSTMSYSEANSLLLRILQHRPRADPTRLEAESGSRSHVHVDKRILNVEQGLGLGGQDIVGIAQIIADQAVPCAGKYPGQPNPKLGVDEREHCPSGAAHILLQLSEDLLRHFLPSLTSCDISRLAAPKDNLMARSSTTPLAKGQPARPPPRADHGPIGPDVFPIATPYVRIQRGEALWEMLPTALAFWETLALAPASGPKDVRAYCLYPSNADIEGVVEDYLDQLGLAYEGCKLGSHMRKFDEDDELDDYPEGMAIVHVDGNESVQPAVQSYADVCRELGTQLAHIGQAESERTIVIYMINPFSVDTSLHALAACFWILYKAYRDATLASRIRSCSDLVLQIVPMDAVASFHSTVVPEFGQMAAVARQVYDRCPPSASLEYASTLPMVAAPAVELASPPPKRIVFQLTPDPPSDLLNDGSAIHLAYSRSDDGQWISATWTDNVGRFSMSSSFCLRGTSLDAVADSLWSGTKDIMAARQVLWRVFIVTVGKVDASEQQCWRSIVTKPLQQLFSVTLLSVEPNPNLVFLSPNVTDGAAKDSLFTQAGFPTPASTPQASNVGASPDANGQSNNAPPTPAPSEAAAIAENENDAQLIDATDESWGVILESKQLPGNGAGSLAKGALIKRGNCADDRSLPTVTVNLLWAVQVRPAGVDEGSPKRCEAILREVLWMYRNLGVLAKARDPYSGKQAIVPWHLCTAMRSARALNGFL